MNTTTVLLIILAYVAANYFTGTSIYRSFSSFINFPAWLFATIWVLLAASSLADIFLGFPEKNNIFRQSLHTVGGIWLAFFIYLFLAAIVAWLISLFTVSTDAIAILTGALSFTAALIISGYGIYNSFSIREKHYYLKLEKDLQTPVKIAMISDVHLGSVGYMERIERVAKIINKAEPDIVCVCGDLFNGDFNSIDNKDGARKVLAGINAKYGKYFCPGNHDSGETYADMMRFAKECGIIPLEDWTVYPGNSIRLTGRRDGSPIGETDGEPRKELPELTSEATGLSVVMDHNPTHYEEYDTNTDLILSGHTHKGQIWPGNLITEALFDADYGSYRKGSLSPRMIVSSGCGVWGPPMRTGSQCEVVIIDITGKNAE